MMTMMMIIKSKKKKKNIIRERNTPKHIVCYIQRDFSEIYMFVIACVFFITYIYDTM